MSSRISKFGRRFCLDSQAVDKQGNGRVACGLGRAKRDMARSRVLANISTTQRRQSGRRGTPGWYDGTGMCVPDLF